MERDMAANQITTGDSELGHPDMDYAAHLATYHMFTQLMKWGAIFVILTILVLAFVTL
jgi:hypothetical protein